MPARLSTERPPNGCSSAMLAQQISVKERAIPALRRAIPAFALSLAG
jgi:hypothetical protein